MIQRARSYVGSYDADKGAWRMPPPSLLALILIALAGAAAFAWSERQIFTRIGQTAVLIDTPVPGGTGGEVWPLGNGAVVWSLVDAAGGPEIRAAIDVPASALHVDIAIRPNADPDLPASHVLEIVAEVPPRFRQRNVVDIGTPTFSTEPGAAGKPLIGTMARVAAGTYLFGLSPVSADVDENLDIMQANFINLPLVYASGQKATLIFEKGTTGSPVFARAIAAWQGR